MSRHRLLRAACRLYPRSRREAWIEDMIAVFDREWLRRRAAGSRVAAARLAGTTLAAALADALRERLAVVASLAGRGWAWDVRTAARGLRRRPGHAAMAVLTLALGVGATTAILAVLHGVLLAALPFPDGERLVVAWRTVPARGWDRVPVSYPNLLEMAAAPAFAEMGAQARGLPLTWVGGEHAERIEGGYLTPSLLRLLGIVPAAGRLLSENETSAGEPVAIVSHEFWRLRLDADPGAIGRPLALAERSPVLVGVLPPGLPLPSPGVDVWLPVGDSPVAAERDTHFLVAFGRLRPEVEPEAAQAQMSAVADRLAASYPEADAGSGIRLEPYADFLLEDVRGVLWMLAGCAGLALAAVCANLAGLTLGRELRRSRELAVRVAMGAPGARVARWILTESVLVGAAGGLLGGMLARGLVAAFLALGPRDLPRRAELGVGGGVMLFAVALAVACGLLFGLLPAWRAGRLDPARGLRGGRGDVGLAAARRSQGLLAGAQVALAVMLLLAGALLGHGFLRLASVDPGFSAEGVLTARVELPGERYSDAEVQAFFDALLGRLEALPQVAAAGATWALPFRPSYASGTYTIAGEPAGDGSEELLVGMVPVRGDLFAALSMPVVSGRALAATDDGGAPPVAVVSEAMARRHWRDPEEAIGKRIVRGETAITVVGVVADVKRSGLDAEAPAEAYLPHAQAAWARDMYIVVRGGGDTAGLGAALRDVVQEMDPAIPVTDIAPLAELVTETLIAPRFRALLVVALASLTLGLALLGVYGVISLLVAARTREIGVRMALGASRRRVLRQTVGSGLRLGGWGALAGVAGALAARRTIQAQLFGVSAVDPPTYAAVVTAVLLVVALAAWLPARRAARIQPTEALRGD